MTTDEQRPEFMFYEADVRIERGEINEATRLLIDLVEKYPDYGRAYNHLGFIYETKYRDFEKAEAFYKKCLETSPEYTAVYLNYAALLSNQRRTDDLEALLYKALECPGINVARVHKEFGILYELRGDYEKAMQSYRAAIAFCFAESEIETLMLSVDRVRQKKHYLN